MQSDSCREIRTYIRTYYSFLVENGNLDNEAKTELPGDIKLSSDERKPAITLLEYKGCVQDDFKAPNYSMGKFSSLLTISLAVLSVRAQNGASPRQAGMRKVLQHQREHLEKMASSLAPPEPNEASSANPPTITFANPDAKKFEVDGTKIANGT